MNYPAIDEITGIITDAHHILIVQADNPDADSLGSSLALEQILGDLGKQVTMYCAVDMPGYLRYLEGWDRVQADLPKQFDASIIVDASTLTLLEKLQQSGQLGWLAAKPSIVLDHHTTVGNPITFAGVSICDAGVSSTGELIYHVSNQATWACSIAAGTNIMTAILGDTQGLSNELATPETYRVMAALIDLGVSRAQLEERRRELSKMPVDIFRYKATLIERTVFSAEGRIATVHIPQTEITRFSPLYNPVPLIHGDILATQGVAIGIVLKEYHDGKVTGAIRCNNGFAIANMLAEHLGGGGHPYASGFKVTHGSTYSEVEATCIAYATELLDNLDKERSNETLQYPH